MKIITKKNAKQFADSLVLEICLILRERGITISERYKLVLQTRLYNNIMGKEKR